MPFRFPLLWLLATFSIAGASAFTEVGDFFYNFFPQVPNRPAALAVALTGLGMWLVIPGCVAPVASWRHDARRFADLACLTLTGWIITAAVIQRVQPLDAAIVIEFGTILIARLFCAFAVARRIPEIYFPLFTVCDFLLPCGAWLMGQYLAMLSAAPAPNFLQISDYGSFFSCLVVCGTPGAFTGIFCAVSLVLGLITAARRTRN